MPWPIRYHEEQPDEAKPGDMWPDPDWLNVPIRAELLSEQYYQRWHGKRLPLVVCLPNGTFFCVDRRPSSGGSGWDVTGEAPNITVSPSISDGPAFSRQYGYHGFLTNGVLSDDVEGRTF